MLRAPVSVNEDRNGVRTGESGLEAEGSAQPDELHEDRVSSVVPTGGHGVPDESERTHLIACITRLLREPTMPEATRCAGMTLIGWLARRRQDEAPHAIGVDEARESERRIRAARAKAR